MSQQGIYSENKMLWWYVRDGGLPAAPKQVQLILSDLCNQDCHFCAYRMSGYTSNELFVGDSKESKYGHNNPARWIPTERALGFIDEFADLGVLSVQFTGGGEPTVHPNHELVFARALEKGLRCALVSNGVKWSPELIDELLPRFDWVRVSIDAGCADSYARIRRTPLSHWDRVWRNATRLSATIRQRGSATQLGLGFVVTPDSYTEILEFVDLAKAAGAHNVRYTAMFSPEDERPFLKIYDDVRGLIAAAKTRADDTFKVYDNFGSRFDDLRQHRPDYRQCAYQHYTAYVGGDMKAYRCCVLAYNRRGLVDGGDLRERSFADYWRDPRRLIDMKKLDARGCERCQFNTKNRGMVEIMSNDMPHKEWP